MEKHVRFSGEVSVTFELDYLVSLALKEATTLAEMQGRDLQAEWDRDGDYLLGIIVKGTFPKEGA